MSQEVNIFSIVDKAQEKGYFYSGDYPGLRLSVDQFAELFEMLRKKGIPLGPAGKKEGFSEKEAVEIITSLRKGVPPPVNVTKFSVGRRGLINSFTRNLQIVAQGKSLVSFMNADYGYGKTHSLYLLRELAFKHGFVVSIVTLSESSCPIHDFMSVYDKVMWNIRTEEQRNSPALENVLDRWLNLVRERGEERARTIIHGLPDDLKCALHAYHETQSPIRPNEERRLFVLNYLSGKNVYLRELRKIGISQRVESSNALPMLGYMAQLFKSLKYRGICVLFDEAESIHSFARIEHRDEAYINLFHIIKNSQQAANCYFLYATTPSFFDNYAHYWPSKHGIESKDILDLERLNVEEFQELASKIFRIYIAYLGKQIPTNVEVILRKLATNPQYSDSLGNFVRRCIAILDEKK